ncbi:DUF4312 family protein [Thermoanaerobacterium thermosaccharolyticum]|uniref:DUF4312 family protein n=2 Tax=Thermoanaerobacterium thermosaccharolyticum TaxID=1517 RepID=D9TQF2_THETC|nr:DUF4312 family protein [Thermoanaerobacterium thermosaccharolyticum]ADL69186.1 conserved hypothetical protein [Thermoanaerobacterium thermosaccharolyticum DSM 571]AGB19319.1 hypothetical protein Thethe_01685 [Thermoanaerobacterium thermosaccharolyticum M0795]
MYKEFEKKLKIKGNGETIEEVFNKIFSQIKSRLVEKTKELLIRIEPKSVVIINARKIVYTERFLGLFFPRKRTFYEIETEITVRVGIIEISQIKFEESENKLSFLCNLKK